MWRLGQPFMQRLSLTRAPFEWRLERIGRETTFGRVVAIVEDAETKPSRVQRFADKFTAYFLPLVAVAAAVTFLDKARSHGDGRGPCGRLLLLGRVGNSDRGTGFVGAAARQGCWSKEAARLRFSRTWTRSSSTKPGLSRSVNRE